MNNRDNLTVLLAHCFNGGGKKNTVHLKEEKLSSSMHDLLINLHLTYKYLNK